MLRLGCSQYVNKNLCSLSQRRTLITTITSKEVDKLNKKKQKRKLASKVLVEPVIDEEDHSSAQTVSLKEKIEQGITVKDASPTKSNLVVKKKSKKGEKKPDVSRLVSILKGKSISASTDAVLSPNPIVEAISQVNDETSDILSTQTLKNTQKNKKKKKKKKAPSIEGLVNETVQLESDPIAKSKLNESIDEIKQTSEEILSSGLKSKKKQRKKKKTKVATTVSSVEKTASTDLSVYDDSILEEAVQISKRKEKKLSMLDSLSEKDSPEILKSVLEMMDIPKQQVESKHNWKKKTKVKDTESMKPPLTPITPQSESEFWNQIKVDPSDKLKMSMFLELTNPVHKRQSQSKEIDNQTKEKEVEEDTVSKLMAGIVEDVDFSNKDAPELFEKIVNMVGENHQTNKLKELVHERSLSEELGESKTNMKSNESKVVINHDKLRFDLEQSSDDRSVSQLLGNLIDGESTKDNLNVFDQIFSGISEYEENLSERERRFLRQKANNMMQRKEKVDLRKGKSTDFFEDNEIMYANEWPTLQEENRNEIINQYFVTQSQYKNKFSLKMNDKEWKYPIDNEQDIGPEDEVHFSEHVFLDNYLHEFPDVGMIRNYMELVITGLQQNPHLSIGEKKERILWHKDYFDNFSEEDFPTSMNL